MNWEDLYSGTALGGAATGATTGAAIGGPIAPYTALAGGLIGGLTGAFANSQRSEATQGQQQNLAQLQRNLRQKSDQRRQQYLSDLEKALSFYGPAQSEWDRLYGRGESPQIGQGSWANTGVK
jgi:hypothetical protein